MGNQAGIIIRNVKNELFHSAKRLILNEVKGIECLHRVEPQTSHIVKEQQASTPADMMLDDIDLSFGSQVSLHIGSCSKSALVSLIKEMEGALC